MRILSSVEYYRRVWRRMSFSTCSAGVLPGPDFCFIFAPYGYDEPETLPSKSPSIGLRAAEGEQSLTSYVLERLRQRPPLLVFLPKAWPFCRLFSFSALGQYKLFEAAFGSSAISGMVTSSKAPGVQHRLARQLWIPTLVHSCISKQLRRKEPTIRTKQSSCHPSDSSVVLRTILGININLWALTSAAINSETAVTRLNPTRSRCVTNQ